MTRRGAPRPLALALEGFTGDLAPASTLARVQGVWERAAGEAVAQAARPTAERAGVLTVTCAEAVWAHELNLMKADLLARVNTALGEQLLHDLRCRVQ
jgi:predicted nucleic acid-binding Zn ribbon protein